MANTKERILLCTNIVNLVEELNGLGLEYEKEKSLDMEMVKYCYKLAGKSLFALIYSTENLYKIYMKKKKKVSHIKCMKK